MVLHILVYYLVNSSQVITRRVRWVKSQRTARWRFGYSYKVIPLIKGVLKGSFSGRTDFKSLGGLWACLLSTRNSWHISIRSEALQSKE